MIGAVPETQTWLADAHRARVADAILERRSGGDELPLHADSVDAMDALRQVEAWPCENVAVVAVTREARRRFSATCSGFTRGRRSRSSPTAVAVLVAAEEGIVDLDEPAGPPGSTVRHLLAHASGLQFEGTHAVARPGARRIYSNRGFDVLGELVAARAEMPFADYFERVWAPGSPAPGPARLGRRGLARQLLVVARELLAPTRIARETLTRR